MDCTLSDLSTGILNLLQPAQLEVVLGQLSIDLASWAGDDGGGVWVRVGGGIIG